MSAKFKDVKVREINGFDLHGCLVYDDFCAISCPPRKGILAQLVILTDYNQINQMFNLSLSPSVFEIPQCFTTNVNYSNNNSSSSGSNNSSSNSSNNNSSNNNNSSSNSSNNNSSNNNSSNNNNSSSNSSNNNSSSSNSSSNSNSSSSSNSSSRNSENQHNKDNMEIPDRKCSSSSSDSQQNPPFIDDQQQPSTTTTNSSSHQSSHSSSVVIPVVRENSVVVIPVVIPPEILCDAAAIPLAHSTAAAASNSSSSSRAEEQTEAEVLKYQSEALKLAEKRTRWIRKLSSSASAETSAAAAAKPKPSGSALGSTSVVSSGDDDDGRSDSQSNALSSPPSSPAAEASDFFSTTDADVDHVSEFLSSVNRESSSNQLSCGGCATETNDPRVLQSWVDEISSLLRSIQSAGCLAVVLAGLVPNELSAASADLIVSGSAAGTAGTEALISSSMFSGRRLDLAGYFAKQFRSELLLPAIFVTHEFREFELIVQLYSRRAVQRAVVTPIPLRRGDHICREIREKGALRLVKHHGIYTGNGRVIHFSGNEMSIKGLLMDSKKTRVCSTTVLKFMKHGSRLKVKKYRRSDDEATVINRAEEVFSQQSFREYNLFSNNCEHFCTYCKTGQARSNQVEKGLTYAAVGVAAVAAVAAIAINSRKRR